MSVIKNLRNLFGKGTGAQPPPRGTSATLHKPGAVAAAGGTALSPKLEPGQTAAAQAGRETRPLRVWQKGELLLGTYRVEDVRAGGMGYVYIAEHLGWKVKLAIKSPNEMMLANKSFFSRVLREAEAWTDLGLHPNIAYCYYVRQVEDVPHIFIEYVDGGNLEDWIESGRCADLKVALDLAIQFCHGMEYAHSHAMIHRDIKPKNILMTKDGTLKVTDFGTARVAGREEAQTSLAGVAGTAGGGLTTFGTQMGTYDYMAPEQWEDPHGVDARADIYSFGVCLYEMVCGRKPYDTASAIPAAVLAQQENRAPHEPVELRPDIPEDLAASLKKCCTLDRGDRCGSFQALRQELTGVYRGLFHAEPPHAEVKLLDLKADGLNNRGVSLLDLGKNQEAEKSFEEALKADPHHLEATYNRGLLLWRAGRMTDDALVKQLEEIRTTHAGDWRAEYLLARVHMERGDAEAAVQLLVEAARQAPEAEELKQALGTALAGKGKWLRRLRNFEGHKADVQCVAIGSDNRWALSGSDDKTLRLWELSTGRCLRTFVGHSNDVLSAAISPDGRWALSAGNEADMRLWEVATGKCVQVLRPGLMTSVCISPDGRSVLAGGPNNNAVQLWELATGRHIRSFEGHTKGVNSVAISRDARWALSGSNDETLRLWEVETGRCVRTFRGHTHSVLSVAISSDCRWGLSGSWDNTVRLWELESGRCVRIFSVHKQWVNSVAISPSADLALSASYDKTVRLWDLATGKCVRTFDADVRHVGMSPDGRCALWGCSTFTRKESLQLLQIRGSGPTAEYAISPPRSYSQIQRLEDNIREAIRNATSAIQKGLKAEAAAEIRRVRSLPGCERDRSLLEFWRELGGQGRCCAFKDGWLVRILEGHTAEVNSVALSPNGRWGLSGAGELMGHVGEVCLWDFETGKPVRSFEGHTSRVESVAFSQDGLWGLSADMGGSIRLWKLGTGECVRTYQGRSIAISPDDRWLVSAVAKDLRLWVLATGRCLRSLEGHTADAESVAITPDGRRGLSGGGQSDGTGCAVCLWELGTGRCLRTFEGHRSIVNSVAIRPDGRIVLSASHDGTLRLWKLDTGKCIRILSGHDAKVNSAAISPDGRWGLSGSGDLFSRDYSVRLWELKTGRCIRIFEGHTYKVNSVAISRDGRWALSGSDDKTLRLWQLVWDYEFPEPADWDEGARPYLENFLTLHTPYAGPDTLERRGRPAWTESEFRQLLTELSHRGYGWLRPEGVRRELERMQLSEPQA